MENDVLCGPLVRYTFIDHTTSTWHGTILIVLRTPNRSGLELPSPQLRIRPAVDERPHAQCLLEEEGHAFWRFSVAVPMGEDDDMRVVYSIVLPGSEHEHKVPRDSPTANTDGSVQEKETQMDDADDEKGEKDENNSTQRPRETERERKSKEYTFCVPAKEETMRMLFHSCNGFSLGVTTGTFAGPVLWKDVLRIHAEQPLHVMIGGGDQVYSDAVRTEGPLKTWSTTLAPRHRAKVPMTDELAAELDAWYFKNYCDWYSKQPFAEAAASIPSLQIFDDHDIIDGYGSYPDKWMRAPIFLGIGNVAWKYYMLFQQHTPPKGEEPEDPSWVLGKQKGPYIREHSRSICTSLGKRVVFFGLDGRVERTLDQVCYPSTYDAMFSRLDKEVVTGQTHHLILLLGVPIAYPRLVWLEHLLSTHTVTIVRWLNRIFGVAGGVFNKYDGSAELLDDLNDHWCAHTHKAERNELVKRLQRFAQRKQVRVTILSGDVHLAAVGRFFSKASLGIPQNKDPRYMVNIVSSAITNAPPPPAIANLLDKRNKLHHLDKNTDENLMALFYQNPDGKANRMNQTTLPARNYCIITMHGGVVRAKKRTGRHENGYFASAAKEQENGHAKMDGESGDMVLARHQTGGIDHPSAAAPQSGTTRKYALDICIRAEIDPKSPEGRTLAYGFSIPFLET